MAENPLTTTFSYSEDTTARKALLKGISDIESQQKRLSIELAKGEITSEKYADAIAKLNKQLVPLNKAIAPLNKEFKEQEKAVKLAEKALLAEAKASDKAAKAAAIEAKALAETQQEAEKAALSFGELANQRKQSIENAGSDFAGQFGTASANVGGGISQLAGGNESVDKATGIAQSIGDLGESLPQLAGQFKTVFETAKSGSGILGGIATALTPALGGTAAAFTAVLLPVAAVAAAIAPLVIAFQLAQKQSEEYVAALGREADVRQAARDAERSANEAAATGDIQRLVDERQAIASELAGVSADYTAENAELLRQNAEIANATLFSLPRGARAAAEEQKTLVAGIGQDITTLTTQLAEYDAALVGVSEVEVNRALNSENLAIIESEVAATEGERTSTLQQLEAAQSRVEALDAQRATMIEARAQQDVFASQTSALENKFANEDQAEQNRELYSELDSIASDGAAKLVAIETELSDLRIEQSQAIAAIEAKGAQKVDKIQQDFFKKTTGDYKKFAAETQKLEETNKRARLKLIQDITDQLDDASRDNNVLAFLEAQRNGQKALKEQAETDTIEAKQRVADFNASQEEARVAQQERLAETVAAIAEEKAQALAAYAEKQAALIASKEAERVAIAQAQAAAIARYTETEAQEAQQADRQRQREELRDQQQETLFQQQLAQIEQKKQAELAAVNAIGSVLTTLASKAAALNAQAQQIASQSAVKAAQSNSSTNTNAPFSGATAGSMFSFSTANYKKVGGGVGAFAKGGIIDRPTLALMGERGREAVVPMRQSEGLPAALNRHGMGGASGGQPINITVPVNMTVGDVASASMVRSEITEAITIVLKDGIAPLLMNSIYPNG